MTTVYWDGVHLAADTRRTFKGKDETTYTDGHCKLITYDRLQKKIVAEPNSSLTVIAVAGSGSVHAIQAFHGMLMFHRDLAKVKEELSNQISKVDCKLLILLSDGTCCRLFYRLCTFNGQSLWVTELERCVGSAMIGSGITVTKFINKYLVKPELPLTSMELCELAGYFDHGTSAEVVYTTLALRESKAHTPMTKTKLKRITKAFSDSVLTKGIKNV